MAKGKIGGLINRMIMGSEKSEGYARSTLPSNRWGLFWDILKGSWTRLLGVNLLILLFFIPLVLVLVYNQAYASYVGGNTPFSQNIGIGYPVIPDMTGVTEQVNVMVTTSTYLFVPLAAVIAAGRRLRHPQHGLDRGDFCRKRFLARHQAELRRDRRGVAFIFHFLCSQ